MKAFKKFMKMIGAYAWQFFKSAFPAMMMYFCAGTVLLLVSMKNNETAVQWSNTILVWTIVCSVAGAAYNGLAMWGIGGGHYEMLVTGNIKRMSMSEIEGGYKMSTHKAVQEYRPWKGFVIGAFCGIFMIFFGILFGCMQSKVDTASGGFIGTLMFICFLTSGCSFLPFYYLNQSGIYVSYFWGCACAIVPIVVSGVFYIIGAYSKRNKRLREQLIANKVAEEEAKKEKKINYGGLPGTKPRKRK